MTILFKLILILLLLVLCLASFYFTFFNGKPVSKIYRGCKNKLYKYSPTTCTPKSYKLTFIFDEKENRFKLHGIWQDSCAECLSCGYPSCCNNDLVYTDPYDPTNFIGRNWFNTTSSEECTDKRNVSLFEHEYYKHISCSNITNTTDFLNLAIELYDKYYDDYVINKCQGCDEIWLNLDENYNYVSTECKK